VIRKWSCQRQRGRGAIFSAGSNLELDAEHEDGPQPHDCDSRHQLPPVPKEKGKSSSSGRSSSTSSEERHQEAVERESGREYAAESRSKRHGKFGDTGDPTTEGTKTVLFATTRAALQLIPNIHTGELTFLGGFGSGYLMATIHVE
jgi:hypothetical protein